MGAEGYPFLGNLAQIPQAEHLEAAAIRKDGTVPLHKLVQPPCLLHQLGAGTQKQMIGVAEHNPCPQLLQFLW